jgi:hypothetical protein
MVEDDVDEDQDGQTEQEIFPDEKKKKKVHFKFLLKSNLHFCRTYATGKPLIKKMIILFILSRMLKLRIRSIIFFEFLMTTFESSVNFRGSSGLGQY